MSLVSNTDQAHHDSAAKKRVGMDSTISRKLDNGTVLFPINPGFGVSQIPRKVIYTLKLP